MAVARTEAAASPIAKAIRWIVGKIVEEAVEPALAENFGRSASALDYRLEAMKTLDEVTSDYFEAYRDVRRNFEEHGHEPGRSDAFVTCNRYFRLPEIQELERLIDEIRELAEVSATLESEVVMRIEADLEESQRRRREHSKNEEYVRGLTRGDIRVPNPEKSRRIAARLSALRAYGFQTQADEQQRERDRTEARGDRIQDLGARAIGNLEAIKVEMRRKDGPFVYLDKELCKQWQDALGL